jgi:hypothetical protein
MEAAGVAPDRIARGASESLVVSAVSSIDDDRDATPDRIESSS